MLLESCPASFAALGCIMSCASSCRSTRRVTRYNQKRGHLLWELLSRALMFTTDKRVHQRSCIFDLLAGFVANLLCKYVCINAKSCHLWFCDNIQRSCNISVAHPLHHGWLRTKVG